MPIGCWATSTATAPALWLGPQIQALRQSCVPNYYLDTRGRIRWRTGDEAGLPPSATAIVCPL